TVSKSRTVGLLQQHSRRADENDAPRQPRLVMCRIEGSGRASGRGWVLRFVNVVRSRRRLLASAWKACGLSGTGLAAGRSVSRARAAGRAYRFTSAAGGTEGCIDGLLERLSRQ